MDIIYLITVFSYMGLLTAWIVMLPLWWGTWVCGTLLFKKLKRVYDFTVIIYWLERLEKGGWREFQKAENEHR